MYLFNNVACRPEIMNTSRQESRLEHKDLMNNLTRDFNINDVTDLEKKYYC